MPPQQRPHDRVRRLTDEHGRVWTVRERVDQRTSRGERRMLVFEANDGMRRLWDYPATWYELGDAELLALSRHS